MRLPQSRIESLSLPVVSITIFLICAATLPLHAQGRGQQQLVSSPASLRFGDIPVGQQETLVVSLTNVGQTTVDISAINNPGSEFSASGPGLPASLGPGASATLSVTFSPTTVAWTGARITVTSTASNPTLPIPVAGTGVSADPMTAAPASLSFGPVALGKSATLPVVLTNARNGNATVTQFEVVGNGFSVSGPTLPAVLTAGQSITVNVTFTPQAAGEAGGSVFVYNPGLNIPLTGTGTTATIVGQLSISPTALNFGNVNEGTTTTLPATLTATGGSVTISSAVSSNSQFTISGTSFPITISAGQSVAVNVAFDPTSSATDSGTLTFGSNASNSPTAESLSGTGIPYSVNLSWSPSTSVSGYNVYRGTAVGSYSKLNPTLDASTAYTDGTVASGVTYYYAVTAVNSSGQESGYSSPLQVSVP